MAKQYTNISGSAATTLVPLRSVQSSTTSRYTVSIDSTKIRSISLSNTHASDNVLVDLWVYKDPDSYYILNNVEIPNGTTLILDSSEVSFDNRYYELKIQLSAGDSAVTAIIN